MNKVVFSDADKIAIDLKLKSPCFSAKTWEDEDIKNIKKHAKDYYIVEQGYKCAYCKVMNKTKNNKVWELEHIISRDQQATFMFTPENLCVACPDCNNAKKQKVVTKSKAKLKYPNRSSQFKIVHPHLDVYEDNILIIEAGVYYVAMEEKGEKTIEYCRLNRFYKYADYSEEALVDNRLLMLSERLMESNNNAEKDAIYREMTTITLKEVIKNKRLSKTN